MTQAKRQRDSPTTATHLRNEETKKKMPLGSAIDHQQSGQKIDDAPTALAGA